MDRIQAHPTLKTLDNLPRVLFWDIDAFLFMVAPIFLSIFMGSLWPACGLIFTPLYRKLKRKMRGGAFCQRIYWMMPSHAMKGMVKTLPPSHQREYLL